MKKILTMVFLPLLLMGSPFGTCVSEAAGPESFPGTNEVPDSRTRKLNPQFVISVGSVLKKIRQDEEIILVDVRNRAQFEKFRIPGSMNIPLFAVKTKPFLKTKPLVLINEGYNYSVLGKECLRLKDAGFDRVFVMFGGLQYWRQKGGPLEGDVFSQNRLSRVSAREFFIEKDLENQTLVNISETVSEEAVRLIPQTISVPYRKKDNEFISDFKDALGMKGGDPLRLVLIYNHDGNYPEGLEALLVKAGIENVYFLEAGLQGYKDFLQQQAQMLQSKNEKKTVKKCASCP